MSTKEEMTIQELLKLNKKMNCGWRIWFRRFDENGKLCGAGVLPDSYHSKRVATEIAQKWFAGDKDVEWTVSETNPLACSGTYNKEKVMSHLRRLLEGGEVKL